MIEALLTHVAVSALIATIFCSVAGKLTVGISVISLVAGTVAGVFVWRHFRNKSYEFETNELWWTVAGTALFFSLIHFARIFFYRNGGWHTLSANNYGDLPLHITYIKSFSSGASFWPENPFFSGVRLTYPIGMDLYNALWDILGVPLSRGLFGVGIVLSVALVLAFGRWGGWLLVGAFFYNGGWPGVTVPNEILHWKNFFLTLLITQRGFLFALPVGALLMNGLWRFYRYNEVPEKRTLALWLFLLGVLPLFHAHSFLAIGFFSGLVLIGKKEWRKIPVLFIPLPLAAVLMWQLTGGGEKASMIHWSLGWMVNGAPFEFWAMNAGPWILFILYCAWEVFLGEQKHLRLWFGLALGSFVFFNFLMLASWDWDNIKVMLWFWLALVPVMNEILASRPFWRWASALLAVVLLGSGLEQVGRSVFSGGSTELYREEDLAKFEFQKVPADAVLATAMTFNHPASFYGRHLVHGYAGHIWSHGLVAGTRPDDLKALFTGGVYDSSIVERYKITHISWGKVEEREYRRDPPPWLSSLKLVSDVEGARVYEVTK